MYIIYILVAIQSNVHPPQDQFSDDIVSRLSIWTINSEKDTLQYALTDYNLVGSSSAKL